MSKFQILSLSGGGIRGLYTVQVLASLEKAEEEFDVIKKFDLICGTSIGGVIALALALGKSPSEIRDVLDGNAKNIFPSNSILWLYTRPLFKLLRNLFVAKYSPLPLRRVLEDLFGENKMKDLKTRVLIPSINYSSGLPKVFKTPHLKEYKYDGEILLVDVALATAAAPTYFPIHDFSKGSFVDGGLIANSPSYCGVHEALYYLEYNKKDISLLSIGTLGSTKTLNENSFIKKLIYNKGLLGWVLPVIELSMASSQSLHEFWVGKILSNRYLKVDDKLENDQSKYISLDNTSDGALKTLKKRGEDRAQLLSGNKTFQKFMNHTASKVTMYEKGVPLGE